MERRVHSQLAYKKSSEDIYVLALSVNTVRLFNITAIGYVICLIYANISFYVYDCRCLLSSAFVTILPKKCLFFSSQTETDFVLKIFYLHCLFAVFNNPTSLGFF